MSSGNLLQSLMQYPKDTINDEMVELAAPYLEAADYNIETARKVNSYGFIISDTLHGLRQTTVPILTPTLNQILVLLKFNKANGCCNPQV